MSPTRRTAIKGTAVVGGLTAIPGAVYATGEHDDDDRETKDDGSEPSAAPEAAVRVAHLSPDAPAVDVYLAGDKVLADVAYGTISHYLGVDTGTYNVRITAAGDAETVVFDDDVTIGSAYYTVAAIGELGADTFQPLILTDAGSALVRLVHTAPDAPAVDVYAGDAALFRNVAFGEASDYVAVPAGDYDLAVRPAGDAETTVATVTASVERGTAYSAFAIGYLEPPSDTDGRDFAVEFAVDGPMAGDC
ncbi:DUF4397 domain-containing protein [Halovivax cerinus]|uniref:DUF4397 domain-containing protein n=1 Tax=Halovivax cerinus TaxID=1487865 RepID=A0ABD5NQM7_9EURY|nr:DUF4397 domain-containing protein [Halovivax cerinus]